MTTIPRVGPPDHGRPMAFDDFAAAEWEDGYEYELIDGKIYVSPIANLPQGRLERWIYRKLDRYADVYPEVVNFVHGKARVFVRGRPGTTCPEPDVAAYQT
jgi:Uma2 family endonuclease